MPLSSTVSVSRSAKPPSNANPRNFANQVIRPTILEGASRILPNVVRVGRGQPQRPKIGGRVRHTMQRKHTGVSGFAAVAAVGLVVTGMVLMSRQSDAG